MADPKNKSADGTIVPSIITLPDGTVCIGDTCTKIKVPPKGKGNIEVDFSDCDESVKKSLVNKILEGVGVEFVNKPKESKESKESKDK